MGAWHFGNTTVRSPFRLREGLLAIKTCNLEGKIRGSEGDINLRKCLGFVGLVKLGDDPTNSVGRKWRSAMEKMGFIIPRVEDAAIQEVIGIPDHVSQNGIRLIETDNLQTWHECFLRALTAYRTNNNQFNPFFFVISLMLKLYDKAGSSKLTKDEMGLFAQFSNESSSADDMADEIIAYRNDLKLLTGRDRKRFIDEKYKNLSGNKQTLSSDYPDVNFRYLKVTGLFKSSKTSILLDNDKLLIAKAINDNEWKPASLLEYYQGLCNGAPLPTDNVAVAKSTITEFAKRLGAFGIDVSLDEIERLTEVSDINAKRHELEAELFKIREREYASLQAKSVEEIIAYIDLLMMPRSTSKTLADGTEVEIPSSERPAYFEWIVWRSFLAINSIVNPPWESRNFKVDPDFKPISHAASGSSDLIFEFDDFVLVVEVTLTTSSRQEAAEGEPVRRHVANYVQKYEKEGKQVYGLFMAIIIDTNTANTFRLGEWYLADDTQIHVQIVPVALKDFRELLDAKKESPNELLSTIRDLLVDCRTEMYKPAPEWKKIIAEKFSSTAKNLKASSAA
jgi:hypothetical protein